MLAPNDLTRPAAIDADGTVEGYASLFGELDQARDMVMPGAFEASLRSRGVRRVPMLFQHDPAEPIGVWLELREDVRGLYARGQLIPEVVRARELIALLKAGGADGLSIGFRTVRGRLDPKTRIRRLYAIDLWEISLVTFPLLPGARVRAVKDAPLALASTASGQREPAKIAAPNGSPPRHSTRHAWPVDPSARSFEPERLFRREPRYRFARGQAALSWRDLILPEHALRTTSPRAVGG
jgi:HK97 family phage prohead protease